MARKGLEIQEEKKELENERRVGTEKKSRKPKNFSYSVQYFQKRKSQLDNTFNQIKPDLMELSEYFSPRMSRFLVSDVNKPIRKSKKILDSITITAVKNFAAGMQSGATSAATRWFKTQMRNKALNNIQNVKVWCSQQEELTRRILAESNFYQLMLGAYKQLASYGFATLSMEPDYRTVVNFKLLPIGSYRYAKDHRGEVDTLCRHFTETAKNIVDNNLSVKYILATHGHFDHTGAVAAMKADFSSDFMIHESDVEILKKGSHHSAMFGLGGYTMPNADVFLNDGDVIKCSDIEISVIHTPGHTAGGVSFYMEALSVLISGDTLFYESVGRTDFETSNSKALVRSVKERLYTLPEDTVVLPGHGEHTSIGHEKLHNPFIRG